MMKKHNRDHGFSLTEILASLVVLSIGMLAIAKVQLAVLHRENFSKQYAEAMTLAGSKIEDFLFFDSIEAGTGTFAYEDIVSGTDNQVVGVTTFTRQWTVTNNLSLGYKLININVTWSGNDAATNSVSMNTIISKINPNELGGTVGSSPAGGVTP